jgi:hypothetical protein
MQNIQCYDYYSMCPTRYLVLHALYYYVNLSISWYPVCVLSCVRVVAIPLGSGVCDSSLRLMCCLGVALFSGCPRCNSFSLLGISTGMPLSWGEGGAVVAGGSCQSLASPLY